MSALFVRFEETVFLFCEMDFHLDFHYTFYVLFFTKTDKEEQGYPLSGTHRIAV